MHSVLFVIAAAALLTAGCSTAPKKADASSSSAQMMPPTTHTTAAEVKKADQAPMENSSSETTTKVQCAVKGDERILTVRIKGKGCELGYTKFGKEGIVASAANGTEYCEKTFAKMKEKLTGSGYDCK